MLEAIVTLPLLILLFFGILEVGRALREYLSVTRIVYEGLRYASSLQSLEAGTSKTDGQIFGTHAAIHARIQRLLTEYKLPITGTIITTTYNAAGGERTVTVEVELSHQPFVNYLRGLRIDVHASGPSLSGSS